MEQLKHDKHALAGFHFMTENKSDKFKQTIRFNYMYAKLSLKPVVFVGRGLPACLPVPQYKTHNSKGIFPSVATL